MSAAADNALHMAGGFGMSLPILLPLVWLPWWTICITLPIVVWGFGLFREQAQHRDEGWFGWFSGPRVLEASSWGIGAAVAAGVFVALQLLL